MIKHTPNVVFVFADGSSTIHAKAKPLTLTKNNQPRAIMEKFRKIMKKSLASIIVPAVLAALPLTVCATAATAQETAESSTATNHLVTELDVQKAGDPLANKPLTLSFELDHESWVYFKADGTFPAGGGVELSFADGRKINLSSDGTPYPGEAMYFLPAGKHSVNATPAPGAKLQQILARSIPEISYFSADYHHPSLKREIPASIIRDFKTLQDRGIIQNYNVVTSERLQETDLYLPESKLWRDSGRKWLAVAKVPRTKNSTALVKSLWAEPMANPNLDGVIVDEFGNGAYYVDQFPFWASELDKLSQRPELKGKQFYGFTGSANDNGVYTPLMTALMKNGYRIAPEIYIRTVGVLNSLPRRMRTWTEAVPGIERRMVIFLGPDNAPENMTFHLHPEMNYKVFLEDQYRMLAMNKSFQGLYGVGAWAARYMNDDILIWNARLIRHYLIEGKTDRLSNDPLMMTYLVNPGFEEREKGWTLSPAADNSIDFHPITALPYTKTAYQSFPEGSTMLSTRRSDIKPNRISQTIQGLQPGRVYQVNVYASDPKQINRQNLIPLSVEVNGAEVIGRENKVLQGKSGKPKAAPAKENESYMPPATGGTPITMSHYNRLFRATSETAELVLSDWVSEDAPGGAAGEQVLWDFIELAPDESLNLPFVKSPTTR